MRTFGRLTESLASTCVIRVITSQLVWQTDHFPTEDLRVQKTRRSQSSRYRPLASSMPPWEHARAASHDRIPRGFPSSVLLDQSRRGPPLPFVPRRLSSVVSTRSYK